MLSNSLLKFAAAENWHVYNKDACVFGTVDGYCVTASTKEALTTFFVPVAGIAPENLIELTMWLEKTRFPLVLVDYEMTDNFIAIRAKDTVFSGTAAQMKGFLDLLAEKLKALEVDPAACAVCGLPAEQKALYVGLFCHIHADCLHKVGVDFTHPERDEDNDNVSEEELLLLNQDADAPEVSDDESDGADETDEALTGAGADGSEALSGDETQDHRNSEEDLQPVPEERLRELAAPFLPDEAAFVDDLTALVAIPSVKGEAEEGAPFGKEPKRALDTFLTIADRMGFDTVNVDHVAGYAEIGEGDEMVACVCHLDVVPEGSGWSQDPWTLTRDGDKLTGRGVMDDKGPALACLYALKALKEDSDFAPNRRVRLIVGTNEETGSRCLAHYRDVEELPVAGFTADAAFPAIYAEKGIARLTFTQPRGADDAIREASAGRAVNMVPGSCDVTLKDGASTTFEGKMAHASTPELGVNAIAEAMQSLARSFEADGRQDRFVTFFNDVIGKETDGTSLGLAFEDETGATTVNAGILAIDDQEASLSIDIRYPVHFDFEAAKAQLEAKLEPYDVKSTVDSHTAPLYLPKSSNLIRTLTETYRELTGTPGEAFAMGGGTYARALPNICAFGAVFPARADVAHQADEHVSLTDLLAGAALYKEALKRLANGSAH